MLFVSCSSSSKSFICLMRRKLGLFFFHQEIYTWFAWYVYIKERTICRRAAWLSVAFFRRKLIPDLHDMFMMFISKKEQFSEDTSSWSSCCLIIPTSLAALPGSTPIEHLQPYLESNTLLPTAKHSRTRSWPDLQLSHPRPTPTSGKHQAYSRNVIRRTCLSSRQTAAVA